VFHRSYIFTIIYITPFANEFNDYVYLQSVYIYTVQPFITANNSDTRDLAKFHEGFLKHINTVFSKLILCVTEGAMGHLRNSQRPQVAHRSQDAYHWST